jgi:hypothetical protein
MFTVAIGHSIDPDAPEAVAEVLAQCQLSLADQTPQAGILFAAIDFDHQRILDEILAVFPDLELVGCTTDGELSSNMGFQQDSLVLMLFSSDEVEIRASVSRNVSAAPIEKVQSLIRSAQANQPNPAKLCLAFPDGLHFNVSEVVTELQAALGPVPLLGGVAAERPKSEVTYQFYRHEVLQDALPILLFSGNLLLSHGFASGWRPIGKQGQVTSAAGNVIYTIDDRPALEFYHHYFQNYSPDAAYPLAVFAPDQAQFFLRGSIGHDPDIGSLSMGGTVPLGSRVQLTEADQDVIVTASKTSLDNAWLSYPGKAPGAALFFSCAWRRWVLGTQVGREYEAIVQSDDSKSLPCCGFYTFGEIAPLIPGGDAWLHNTTFITLLLGTH